MKKVTQQYKDLIALVDIQIMPQEEKFAKHYWRNIHILKILIAGSLIFPFYATIFSPEREMAAYAIWFAFVLLYIFCRGYYAYKMRSVLLEDCDPIRMLGIYSALFSLTNRTDNWVQHFYNVAISLYYAGRMEDVEKVLSLLAKYCPGNQGKMCYEMIAVNLAAYKGEFEDMEEHCRTMSQLKKYVRLTGFMRFIYIGRMMYPELVQMSKNGEYDKLYHNIEKALSLRKSLLTEVKRNYYLYKVALMQGDEVKAEEHKKFVIQHGGKLWYRKEIEG